ncbi:MAG: ketopantoate reductase C-terminal domain-containing protein, partial [Pseudomonadota bacterium]
PGVITRYGVPRRFSIGALDGSQSSVGDILACFRAAGIEAPDLGDIRTDLWTKFILFNATSSITAGTRCRFGVLRDLPEVVDLARTIMKETHAVGVASGVPLPETLIEECLRLFLEELPSDGRTSTAHDLEDGRALEIDHISGAVARRGRELGVDVTASETVYALLRPWRDGR